MIARMKSLPHALFWAFGAALLTLVPPGWAMLGPTLGALAAFDIAALVFFVLAFATMRGAGHEAMRRRAARNDAGRSWLLAITALVLGIVLVAVAVEVQAAGWTLMTKVLPLLSLALAWLFGNVVFALHYAQLYYRRQGSKDAGGLQLPGGDAPVYADFLYFALTIGMTFQVSDIVITGREIRVVSLVHALIAFVFNVGVLALSVNILASG